MSRTNGSVVEEFPPVAHYSKEKFEQWLQRHGGAPFSGQWNAILAQRMRDPEVYDADRYLSWLTLYAAGNFSDWPVDSEGNEKFQRDCVRDTGMDRRRVSDAVALNATLGYVLLPDRKGRFMNGTSGPPGRMIQADGGAVAANLCQEAKKERMASGHTGQAYSDFRDEWLSQHPDKQRERAEAVAVVEAIDFQILSDWQRKKEDPCDEESPEASKSADDLSGHVGQNVRTVRSKRPDSSVKTGAYPYNALTPNTEKAASSSLRSSSTAVERPSQPMTTTSAVVANTKTALKECLHEMEELDIAFLQEHTGIKDPSAVMVLIKKCRKKRPTITIAEIWEFWKLKFQQIAHKQRDPDTKNFVGLMIKSVAEMVTA